MKQHIETFFDQVRSGESEIYNEFSLQHELGMFLRNLMPSHKVQIERNVSFFEYQKSNPYKKEIDITISGIENGRPMCALELKYPRNGQVPKSMYSFCKDIAFLEQRAVNNMYRQIISSSLNPNTIGLSIITILTYS